MEPAESRSRLLLVDDHALFREGLAGLFAYQADFEIVGQAGDAENALEQMRNLRPDMVLMDIDLPGADGITVTRQLKTDFPDVIVVMLTVHDATDKLIDGDQGWCPGLRREEHPQRRTAGTAARIAPRRGGCHSTHGRAHPRGVSASSRTRG